MGRRFQLSDGGEDVRVTGILDGEDTDAVESADSGAELDIVAFPVEDLGAAEDGHVLELSTSDGGAVVRNDDKLGLTVSQSLHGSLEACSKTAC